VLPAQVSSFVGRARELAELEVLLAKSRLVTLTGAGGSGKTRLALEAAERTRQRLGQPTYFVDLAPITDPGLVVSSLAAALGVRERPRRPLLDTLVDALGERRLFLVLDNLEQLLPTAATLIAGLLARCPNLRILCTSRAPLRVRGEHEYAVDPLDLPDEADLATPDRLGQTEAVALFVERARGADPHFSLTVDNAAVVAGICRRLDGLPLAIELAAGRSKLLTPDALLRRLEHRLPLLTTGLADAPARQRTLRDAIAWSYDLLDPTDQRVFARLSVFVGGFLLGAAEAVVPDPADPTPLESLEALGRLVDRSLVRVELQAEGGARFHLLETIREFALEQGSEIDAEPLRRRHADNFAMLAEEAEPMLFGAEGASWRGRLTRDLDNLRAALEGADASGDAERLCRLVVALMWFLWETGHHEELGRWLRTAETAATGVEPRTQARVCRYLAQYELAHSGSRVQGKALLTKALAIDESIGDGVEMARTLIMLADVDSDLGDLDSARNSRDRALTVAREIADPAWLASLLAALAWSYRSVSLANEAVALGRETRDPHALANGMGFLAITALIEGDATAAAVGLSACVRIWEEVGSMLSFVWTTARLGTARLRTGDIDGGRALLRDALGRVDEVGMVWVSLSALEGAADWLGAVGRNDAATVCWAAVDATQTATLDRTDAHNLGFFLASRARDLTALSQVEYEAARSHGAEMSLDDAVDYAIRMLDETALDGSDRRLRDQRPRGRHDLTPREREVLELLAAGRSDGEIAQSLFISKKTAAVHVANIKGKLGAGSRVEIVRIALRSGLVETVP
jgi:predicted ATPase/DNA-binding CsgD family transcriptional regulator